MSFIKGLAYFFTGLTLFTVYASMNMPPMAQEEGGVIILILAGISIGLHYIANKKKLKSKNKNGEK